MNLEDLVRNTLAARAHDVDGVDLLARRAEPPRHVRRHRLTAAVAVAVAAAAVVIAIAAVTLAGVSDRATPAPGATAVAPTPAPPGMQYVSHHGVTLTVPADWPVQPFGCVEPLSNAVVVPVPASPACGHQVKPGTPPDATVLYLNGSSGEVGGAPVSLAGLAATRSVGIDPFFPDEVLVAVHFTDLSFGISVRAPTVAQADAVLDTARATAVDDRGCTEQLDGDVPDGNARSDQMVPSRPVDVIVCEYLSTAPAPSDQVLWLNASRELGTDEIDGLVNVIDAASTYNPLAHGPTVYGSDPLRYLMRFTDGSARVIDVRYRQDALVASDGQRQLTLQRPELRVRYDPPAGF